MKKYKGSEKGPRGMYLNLSSLEFIQINEETGILPGENKVSYIKVPLIFAMVGGPVAGLGFILFLPFVGIVGILGFFGYKLYKGTVNLVNKTVQLATFSWQPGRAYFNPVQRKTGAGTDEGEKELNEIKEEVERHKRQGES